MYTRSIMNVSRALFTHSRQNGTLAESRSEEGSLTGSSAQPDTWRIPHSSPPFQPGTHTRGVMLRHDRTEGWLEILGAVSSDP